jgi:Mrp family chromosome partitioning ATPase
VVDQLHKSGCNVLGVVLNDFNPRAHAYGSYYRGYSSYNYGYGEKPGKRAKSARRKAQESDD